MILEGNMPRLYARLASGCLSVEILLAGNFLRRKADEGSEGAPVTRCSRCHKPISRARLRALPAATLCRACKAVDDEPPLRPDDPGVVVAEAGEVAPGEVGM
jgi:hypothetical protein